MNENKLREQVCILASSMFERGITHGSTGNISVRLEDDDLSSQAKGSDPDIIVASAKAYISALNRLIFKKTKSIVKKSDEFKIEGV